MNKLKLFYYKSALRFLISIKRSLFSIRILFRYLRFRLSKEHEKAEGLQFSEIYLATSRGMKYLPLVTTGNILDLQSMRVRKMTPFELRNELATLYPTEFLINELNRPRGQQHDEFRASSFMESSILNNRAR